MKILVTGGAGFIGSHYVRSLLAGRYPGFEHAEVTVLDKLTYAGNLRNLPAEHPRLTFVRGDICDRNLLALVVPGHDAVVHFAAESHVDRSLRDAGAFMLTNVVGTERLLDACRAACVPRVVHVSTDEVYGSVAEGSWTESSPLEPNSPYSASKASSDLIARAYHRSHGLPVSITRCCNNYGPYQFLEKVVPLFVTHLLDGRDVPLYGDGTNQREWIHVDDHCRAVQSVLTGGRAGEIYNIGGDQLSNLQLTEQLLRLCEAGWERVARVADRAGHDWRYSVDDTKLHTELGFSRATGLQEGLTATVRWYRANRWWWEEFAAVG
ncbi:dTDP-glucose 4,6-dehydratase [Micromonospora sp. PTRAS2]